MGYYKLLRKQWEYSYQNNKYTPKTHVSIVKVNFFYAINLIKGSLNLICKQEQLAGANN